MLLCGGCHNYAIHPVIVKLLSTSDFYGAPTKHCSVRDCSFHWFCPNTAVLLTKNHYRALGGPTFEVSAGETALETAFCKRDSCLHLEDKVLSAGATHSMSTLFTG